MRSDATLRLSAHITRAGEGEQFQLGVEIEVPPGITILFGPSGSGKSTCLQIIAGLLRPDRGRVALGDEPWLDTETGIDLPVHRRHVAYVFQSLALFPHMTAERNVMYGIPRHIDKHERRERARAMLDKLAVGHLAGRKPRTFSGGEAQRVALARALATSPRVLLLDEPFSALDRDLRVQLARLVRELVDELGLPTVQVTHNHGEARAMGDRVLRMERGGVIAQGSVPDVLGADERGGHEVGTNEQARSRFDDIGRTPMPVLRPGEPER